MISASQDSDVYGKSHLVPNLKAVLDYKLDKLLVLDGQ